jgi:hypothetical protein
VRVKRPERFQVQWRDASLDQLIPKDHRVRAVWAYVDSLDLKPLNQMFQAVSKDSGRQRRSWTRCRGPRDSDGLVDVRHH